MAANIFFIINPNSRSGKTKKIWEQSILPKALKLFSNISWSFTNYQTEASLLASHAKKLNYNIVVAVGGDGTINEVVNGLMDNQLNLSHITLPKIFSNQLNMPVNNNTYPNTPSLACLPAGTGCDFIKSINIPNNIDSALNIIKTGKILHCDIGLIKFLKNQDSQDYSNMRYFINIAGCGANAETALRINKSNKFFGRKASFLIAAIQTLLKNKNYPVRISCDGEAYSSVNLRALFICNGQFCGGGMHISKNASLQSGKFQIVLIKRMNMIKSILLLNRLYSGDYSGLEMDIIEKNASHINIITNEKYLIPAECDGEQPGYLPISFSLLPKALPVISNI